MARTPGRARSGALGRIGELVRTGAAALVTAAADDETAKALDRAAGPQWRWIARVGTLVSLVARSLIRGLDSRDRAERERGTGEPGPFSPDPDPATGRDRMDSPPAS